MKLTMDANKTVTDVDTACQSMAYKKPHEMISNTRPESTHLGMVIPQKWDNTRN